MDGRKDTVIEAILEHLIEHGASDIATVFGRAFELAMPIEPENGAGIIGHGTARIIRAGAA